MDRKPEDGGASPGMVLAGLGAALAVMFVIILIFKVVFMAQDERYLRGCIQETARLSGRGGLHARLYRPFPWFSPLVEPRGAEMRKVWNFCRETYNRESDARGLYAAMHTTVEGSHSRGAAAAVINRMDKGWSAAPNAKQERETLQHAVDTWDVNGHNPDVQRILESYNRSLSTTARIKDYDRIFNPRKGFFKKQDICRNTMLFEKWKIVPDPAAVYRAIPCR